MKLIFQKIRYKNFLSSGNNFTEINLNKDLITLIIGKNGAGKSTILDALCFCLFKKPFRKITLGLLVNSVIKKQAVVEVEFSIGIDQYKVVRGLKPTIFEVYKNGTLLNQTNSDDYQTYLEDHILRVNHKAFCQIVVLGSANYIPFLELSVPDRRKIIENLLDLEIFSLMNIILKKKLQETEKRILEVCHEKNIMEVKLESLKEFNEKQKKSNFEQIEFLEKKLQGYRDLITDKKTFLSDVSLEELKTIKEKIISVTKEISNFESTKNINNSKYKLLEKEINFYEKNCTCDMCNQEIDEYFKKKIIENKKKEQADLLEEIKNNSDNINKLETGLKILEAEKYGIEQKISFQEKIKFEINILIKDGKACKQELDTLKSTIIRDETESILKIEKEIEEIRIEYDLLNKDKEKKSIILKMLKDDGVKANIISEYIDIINECINDYLLKMDFMCQFNLDENFNEKIKSRYRDEFVYNSFSEGEKMRIDLAILFTWREVASRRNSINTNILFFDETLDSSLDADGVDSYIQIIKNLTKDENVFIISHNDKNIDKIDNIIQFKKKKGFSFVI